MIFMKYGWKPGAISKRLLRALNEAKLRRSVAEQQQTKKAKKRTEAKPALIISKKDGEYRVEMNMLPNSKDGVECTPLIYRIEAANNKARNIKKATQQRRLIRAAVDAAWSDPYQPRNCENICLPAYYRALGINEDGVHAKNKDDEVLSSCSDQDYSSGCSSSDIDWELQFNPPSVFR